MASKSATYRDDLMKGRIRVETKAPSNIVRVFVSSTFADMSDERNVLYNRAYPELRNFCQNLGLEFQVIDMRWGIRDTASVDHSTTALCLLEVKTCKTVSLGPYFVVFFGNRYGYQPLPTAIKQSEFKNLQQIATEQKLDENGLMDKWYKLDKNNIPHARILEPITNHFSHFDDTNSEFAEKQEADRESWNEIFKHLSNILRNAAEIAVKRGLLSEKSHLNFCKSITHMEVEEALQEQGESPLIAYSREISDLQKHTNENKARKFTDLVEGENKIDASRQRMLKALKKMVKQHIGGKKMFKKYDVSWKNLDGSQDDEKWEGVYLQSFCEDFLSDMKSSIVSGLTRKENAKKKETSEDSLLEEVVHHARFEVLKTADFCGREQLIGQISDLIFDKNNRQPIVLEGRSGCGKTSLIAKLVETQRNHSSESVIVYRFLGTSPDSSNIHKLLTSLIRQISAVYGEELPASYLLQNFADVVEHFAKLLNRVSERIQGKEDNYLLIFIDSIDQLSVEDGAHRMTWLPKTTPEKVKITISSLPAPSFVIVPTMRRYVPETNVLTVQGLTVETAEEILHKCLGNEGRQLTDSQITKILKAFEVSPYPLFLKLMLEEAKRWRSHDDLEGLELPRTARSAISRFYERLEKEHGKTFTSRAIGFIVAARDGVTENELQDLLSLDDDVLYDVYEHWSPPLEGTVRIPSFTWTRLNYDLSKYIVQRQATGHTVLALYHRQFIEVTREKYLRSSDSIDVYRVLSEYFLGTFAEGTPKRLKLKMWEESREVDRRVAKQPTRFSSNVFNVRKLRELPFCLLKAKYFEQLKTVVLANPEWILTKIEAFSIKEVIEDYNLVLSEVDDTEIKLIRDAIKLAKPTLEFPGVRNHLFTELYCRLKFFCEQFPNHLKSLVTRCSNLLEVNSNERLLPLSGYFQPPGGPLRATITGFKNPVTCLKFLYEENIFAAGSKDGTLLVWDTTNDEILHKIEAHSADITAVAFSGAAMGDKVASCSKDKTIKMFQLDNGNQCLNKSIDELETTEFVKLFVANEQLLCVSDFKIKCWNIVTKEQDFEKEFSSAITCACKLEKYIIVGQKDGQCLSFDVETGEQNAGMEKSESPVVNIFVLNEEGNSNCVVIRQNGQASLKNVQTLEIQDTVQIDNENVLDSCASRTGSKFAVAFSEVVEVYSINSGKIKFECHISDYDSKVATARFIGTDTMAVGYENKKVVLWKINDGNKPVRSNIWEGMGAPIHHMEIGQHIGVTGSKKVFYLKVWDLDHQDDVKLDPALPLYPNKSAMNSCGKHVAYVESGNIIVQKVDNFVDGVHKEKKVVPDIDARHINFIKFAGRGNDLVVAKSDGSVVKIRGKQGEDNNLQLVTEEVGDTYSGPRAEILLMSVSNDGNTIAVLLKTQNGKYSVQCLDEDNLRQLWSIALSEVEIDGEITSICSAGDMVLIGTSEGCLYAVTKLSNKDEPFQIKTASSKHGSPITCLAVNHTGDCLFSGSRGRTRRVWELKNGTAILKHELHFESLLQGGVTCAQFTHDDKYIVTGSLERSITIWDSQTGALIGSQYVYAPVLDVVVTEDSKLIYTSELGYVAVAKFRPPTSTSKRSSSKIRNQSRSSTCRIM